MHRRVIFTGTMGAIAAIAMASMASTASAGAQQASFAVQVRLQQAAKYPSPTELCAEGKTLDAGSLQRLGVHIRVDCPPAFMRAKPEPAKVADTSPAERAEVTVSY